MFLPLECETYVSIQSTTDSISEGCIVGCVLGAIWSDKAVDAYGNTYTLCGCGTYVYTQLRICKELVYSALYIAYIEHYGLLGCEVSASRQGKEWRASTIDEVCSEIGKYGYRHQMSVDRSSGNTLDAIVSSEILRSEIGVEVNADTSTEE